MNLYVGNLPYDISEDDLRAAFAAYGEVTSASIISDRETGRSKGFGFVEMPNNSSADAAIKGLNGRALNGRAIKVNESKPRNDRGGGRANRW